MKKSINLILFFLVFGIVNLFSQNVQNQDHSQDHGGRSHNTNFEEKRNANKVEAHDTHGEELHDAHGEEEFNVKNTAFHHIGNQNVFSIGSFNFPLPAFLYAPGKGWSVFMSSKFDIGHHGNGHKVHNGYVLSEGSIFRIADESFDREKDYEIQKIDRLQETVNGKKKEVQYAYIDGSKYKLDARSSWDGGFLGGGLTSFYDFSISKNVLIMILTALLLFWLFTKIARDYKKREGKSPKGLQSFFEPIILFVREDIAKPFIGEKYQKYLPYLLAIFFFILTLNMLGQIPFIGSANTTGNLSVTMGLAFIAFFIVNLSGKKYYWEHIFWMPGVPWWVKATILTPIEFLGLFIKPFTLMLRLFANISAGHMVIIVFLGLIFIFGKNGIDITGSITGMAMAIPLVMFMMALEIIVALVQAFVFTMLVASYIGAAVEEHH